MSDKILAITILCLGLAILFAQARGWLP